MQMLNGTDNAQAVAGWLADHSSSRKSFYVFGLGILAVATVLFAVARGPVTLMIARCLQGASAGAVWTIGLTIVVDTVDRHEVGSWMGFVMSGMTIGTFFGPSVGGLIYEKLGYHIVFVLVLALIALNFIMPLYMIEKSTAQRWLSTSPSKQYVYGTRGNSTYDHDVAESIAQVGNQKQRIDDGELSRASDNEQEPLIHRSRATETSSTTQKDRSNAARSRQAKRFSAISALLSSRQLVAALYGGFVQVSITCALDSILPLFVQRTFGWNSSATGLIFFAISGPMFFSPVAGALSDRFGARIVVLVGFIITAAALALLCLVKSNSIAHKVLLALLLIVIGKSFISPVHACRPPTEKIAAYANDAYLSFSCNQVLA